MYVCVSVCVSVRVWSVCVGKGDFVPVVLLLTTEVESTV